jgi:hypothetical protein
MKSLYLNQCSILAMSEITKPICPLKKSRFFRMKILLFLNIQFRYNSSISSINKTTILLQSILNKVEIYYGYPNFCYFHAVKYTTP